MPCRRKRRLETEPGDRCPVPWHFIDNRVRLRIATDSAQAYLTGAEPFVRQEAGYMAGSTTVGAPRTTAALKAPPLVSQRHND